MQRSAKVDAKQLELPFALLDFHGITILTVKDVAKRLNCTTQHVCNLIQCGELTALSIGTGQSRTSARIPVEAFRDFVIKSMTCPWEQSPLRHLPLQSLIRLHGDLTAHIRNKGIRV